MTRDCRYGGNMVTVTALPQSAFICLDYTLEVFYTLGWIVLQYITVCFHPSFGVLNTADADIEEGTVSITHCVFL
jgi:hypothetical protein